MRVSLSALVLLTFTTSAWAQQSPTPAEAVPSLEFAFEEVVTLGPTMGVGETGLGRRTIVPITGGHFAGPRIRGAVMPGGWDWQLLRSDGCTELDADYMLRTDDGAIINVRNKGVACPPGTAGAATGIRTIAAFEAPLGKHHWLASSAFVGMLVPQESPAVPAVKIRFYRVR